MNLNVITSLFILFTVQISLVYADSFTYTTHDFTYQEILNNRFNQPLPGDYQTRTNASDSPFNFFVKRYTERSGFLSFVLFQQDSFTLNSYNFFMTNFTEDIILMNFGRYANMSVNIRNATMNNQYLQISIPFSDWYNKPKEKPVKN
jgi:hypothetical protein